MNVPQPFVINTSPEKLDWIHERVKAYQWFPEPIDEQALGGWAYGMSTPVLKEIQSYWVNEYNWRDKEKILNSRPHYKVEIDGIEIHFLHIVGEADGRRPLLLTHGWPGSVFEFWNVVGPLAFPTRHGGDPSDAFDLVIPSLPGYGWSGKPRSPIGQKATARMWNTLMQECLRYESYLAQGGDWGALVTSWLGYNHGTDKGGGCAGIHLNMIGFRPTPATPQNDEEKQWLETTAAAMQAEGSYFMQQATKPQTLALALMDSPLGQAAWILEKFNQWSDLRDKPMLGTYTMDQLLTNVMIYLVNDAFATSVWYYNALFREGGINLPEGKRCETPTAFANYPGESLYTAPPRSWCDRAYNIVHWAEMNKGGHFAAMESPKDFVDDIRLWARKYN